MKFAICLTLLFFVYFTFADISDTVINKRREAFQKLSDKQKEEKMKTSVAKYLKKYPKTSAKEASYFVGAQYYSSLSAKSIIEMYKSTFKKNDRQECYNKCALQHQMCTVRCLMVPDRKKCEEQCDLTIKACNKICNDKYPFFTEKKIKGTNVVVRKFKNYEVYFDQVRAHAINSTQWGWIDNPGDRPNWRNDPYSRIKHTDYIGVGYDRGHLSPYNILGYDSMNIINAVPQLPCHNRGVWGQFEDFVEKNYKGEKVVTLALYENNDKLDTANGPLYIPTKFCKVIRGKKHCMIHDEKVCGIKWCDSLVPKIVSSC
eukprot:gene2157-2022_t